MNHVLGQRVLLSILLKLEDAYKRFT
jgi:hypothetical protein